MSGFFLPVSLAKILQTDQEPGAIFATLLPALGEVLACDRCFLYLRNPRTRVGRTPYCWRRDPQFPDVTSPDWRTEPDSLAQEDPLFAAALHLEASVYVEDVETADPKVVNRAFERENFGHRALIHAHLRQDGQLWGILQPCVFGAPRVWTAHDRSIMAEIEQQATPLAVAYIQALPQSGDLAL